VWLLPLLPRLARAAAFTYYRVRYAGEYVPSKGPALLVANHPNSLLDPVLVVAAVARPVRFLAKAPLFTTPSIGRVIKAAGAIPVYRKVDDPTQMRRNVDSFRAVYDALEQGAAVGIFPEGISHSEPSLVPIKTGAARIALGAFPQTKAAFPIIPVGLVLRDKDVFRSDALVFVGRSIPWSDLAARGLDDPDAVHELTDRISDGLRQVTVNLDKWEDRPLVEFAIRVWETEQRARRNPAERLSRLEITTKILAEVRRSEDREAIALTREVEAHRRRLRALKLRPADLVADVGISRGLRWAAARVHLLLPLGVSLAIVGQALFYVPYKFTGWLVERLRLEEDLRSTYKLLGGFIFYLLWIILLAVVAWLKIGALAGILSVVLIPVMGVATLLVRERWRSAWSDARRFFLLRSRRQLIDTLRTRQRELGARMDRLFNDYVSRGAA
jgi:1-acyl-sn-glycerol-3-phosphate acyltransferase